MQTLNGYKSGKKTALLNAQATLENLIKAGKIYFSELVGEHSQTLQKANHWMNKANALIEFRKHREQERISVLKSITKEIGYDVIDHERKQMMLAFREIAENPEIPKSRKAIEFDKLRRLSEHEEQLFNRHLKPVVEAGLHEDSAFEQQISDLLKNAYKANLTANQRFIMNALSQVPKSEGKDFAESIVVDCEARRRLKRCGYDIRVMRNDISDFYRLTGRKLHPVRFSDNGSDRANTLVFSRQIFIDDLFGRFSLFHELGHTLEYKSVYREVGQAFIQKRKNEGGKFHDDYVSRTYPDGCTEVLAMGMQELATANRLAGLHHKDPELLYLVLGICATN